MTGSCLEENLELFASDLTDTVDLLNKLLTKDPKIRISLDSALNHAWFKDVDLNPKTGQLKNRQQSKSFKQKKMGMTSQNSSHFQSLNVSQVTES